VDVERTGWAAARLGRVFNLGRLYELLVESAGLVRNQETTHKVSPTPSSSWVDVERTGGAAACLGRVFDRGRLEELLLGSARFICGSNMLTEGVHDRWNHIAV
jgi:hypothetical protein